MRDRVIALINAERDRQDSIHGGPKHDDTHCFWSWPVFIQGKLDDLDAYHAGNDEVYDSEVAAYLVKIAALAVAGLEVLHRHHGEKWKDGIPNQDRRGF